ncbi:DUF6572 domain-containing protein [uncultured Friedmanniella sp.]|uniref:DUF6572 domain-containing protein n=1 Tax=uncultured Friedmanniella sp. TaxID=335381 RepID=UPI0035CC15AA
MSGLDDAGVVDAITQTPEGEVVLIISHDRPWTDSEDELSRLGEKINNYAFFVLDEGFALAYPDAVEQPKRVQVDCVSPPTPQVAELLTQAEAAFAA